MAILDRPWASLPVTTRLIGFGSFTIDFPFRW
jgi:hypothetical protein